MPTSGEPYVNADGMLVYPAPDPAPPAEPKRRGAGKRRTRRRKCWSLARVHAECSAAPVVWLALLQLADGVGVVTPTRATIAERSGVKRLPTISKALTTLADAGWIARHHVPVKGGGKRATLMRIWILRRSER